MIRDIRSPEQMAIEKLKSELNGKLEKLEETLQILDSRIGNIEDELYLKSDKVERRMERKIEGEIKGKIENELKKKIEKELEEMGKALKKEMVVKLKRETKTEIERNVKAEARQEIRETITPKIDKEIKKAVETIKQKSERNIEKYISTLEREIENVKKMINTYKRSSTNKNTTDKRTKNDKIRDEKISAFIRKIDQLSTLYKKYSFIITPITEAYHFLLTIDLMIEGREPKSYSKIIEYMKREYGERAVYFLDAAIFAASASGRYSLRSNLISIKRMMKSNKKSAVFYDQIDISDSEFGQKIRELDKEVREDMKEARKVNDMYINMLMNMEEEEEEEEEEE